MNDWNLLKKSQKIESYSELARNCIWYNSNISKNTLFFADWYKKGIYTVSDIIDTTGEMLSLKDLKEKYNFKPNILNYYTIKAKIELYMSKYKFQERYTIPKPIIPRHLDVVFKSRKGCKTFYDAYRDNETQNLTPKSESLWANIVRYQNQEISIKEKWKRIYEICFFAVPDNDIIWFQYRILNKILGTKDYLKKVGIQTTNLCSLCKIDDENLDHILYQCREVTELWENVKNWIKNKTGINITLTITMKTVGYLVKDQNFWPLNMILTITRK